MGKKVQKCQKNCQKHHFIMKPVQYFAYISRDVQVSFCPQTLKHYPNYPIFNKDRKHYTSSFCLKEDEMKYSNNDLAYKKEHQKFCVQQLNGKSEMLQPKPRSKLSYCHVCKEHYEDYFEHMKSFSHKKCVRENKFSGYVNDLIIEKYSDLQPTKDQISLTQEQSYCQKEICSNTTLPSSLILDQPKQSLGFTFVSGQGAFELHHSKIKKLKSQSFLGENLIIKEALSPQFQNLLRRCSTTDVLLGSQKKNLTTTVTKFPIIVTPLE